MATVSGSEGDRGRGNPPEDFEHSASVGKGVPSHKAHESIRVVPVEKAERASSAAPLSEILSQVAGIRERLAALIRTLESRQAKLKTRTVAEEDSRIEEVSSVGGPPAAASALCRSPVQR